MQKYRQAVMEMNDLEGKVSEEILDQVLPHFNISQECFQGSWQLGNLPENNQKF